MPGNDMDCPKHLITWCEYGVMDFVLMYLQSNPHVLFIIGVVVTAWFAHWAARYWI